MAVDVIDDSLVGDLVGRDQAEIISIWETDVLLATEIITMVKLF